MKWAKRLSIVSTVVLIGPVLSIACGQVHLDRDWRTASRVSAQIAPAPEIPEAIVQIYAARAFNWRGIFGVHTWIATKRSQDQHFVVHDVIGWRRFSNRAVLASYVDVPDRLWFGNQPEILVDLRGQAAEEAILHIADAIGTYPYTWDYRLWPGPNSNTFTAFVGRHVPELRLHLPPTAIGKDFLENSTILARTPSGTGYQLSLAGLVGMTAAWREGIEMNIIGLVFGVDVRRPAIKLPGIGRVGFSQD
tara:strand:- start:217 stop:963 length:747 start_codon:yes stop_codon:yes gene_type:complete